MSDSKSLKSNFFYQVIYNLVVLVIPLITTPFVSRTLLEDGVGRFTFTRSIASYFVIAAMMGIAKYGQRLISKNSGDQNGLRKSFWSLFYVHSLFSAASIVVYVIFALLIKTDSRTLFFIQTIYVLSALFDITWLFYGLEDFRTVVIVNSIVRVLEAVLIIVFVRAPEDIALYAIISCSAFLISQIAMLPFAVCKIKPIKVGWNDCKIHIKPLLVFAVAVVGISLYTVFDTTLLGLFSTKEDVAFYEYANRIVKIPLVVASIIGTVMLPRACKLAGQNKIEEQKNNMYYSLLVVSIIASSSIFGLMIVGKPLAVFYLGENYQKSGDLIKWLSPLIFIVGFGDVIRTQCMIPNGMDKQYVTSILLNAAANLIISTFLIILLPDENKIFGAVFGTIAAEFLGLVYQFIVCRKYMSVRKLIKPVLSVFLIGLIMFAVLFLVTMNISWTIPYLVMVIVLGAVLFLPLSLLYICIFEKDFRKLLFKK